MKVETLKKLKKAILNGGDLKTLLNERYVFDRYIKVKNLEGLTETEKELFKDEINKIVYEKTISVENKDYNMKISCNLKSIKTYLNNRKIVINCDRKKSFRKEDKKLAYNDLLDKLETLKKEAYNELVESERLEHKIIYSVNVLRGFLEYIKVVKNISEVELNRILDDYISYKVDNNKEALKDYDGFENINVYKSRPDGFGHQIVTHPVIDYFNKKITLISWGSDD